MSALSLLEGCQTIFEKTHETWKSYFSRWESLAGLEEDIPLDSYIKKKNASTKKPKKKTSLLKNRRILKKRIIRRKKVAKKNKNKTKKEVIEQQKGSGNENLPEETDNKQLEMHLRTIFMDILKANKNKWEVFAVLSQTFSHGDITIKFPHSLRPNHQLALPSSQDIEQCDANFLFRKTDLFFPTMRLFGNRIHAGEIEFFGNGFSAINVEKKETFNCMVPQNHSDAFKFCIDNRSLPFSKGSFTPPNSGKIIFNFKSCPSLFFNTSRYQMTESRLPAFSFDHKRTPTSCRKTRNFFERKFPEMNITREGKGVESLCLHKRTNSLNMKNSNFVTPERNPSKRKCFSENIPQRKRRRRTKLFFDFRDSSDSENDEQSKMSTPRIGWRRETRKIGISNEVVPVKSDSDESDSIL